MIADSDQVWLTITLKADGQAKGESELRRVFMAIAVHRYDIIIDERNAWERDTAP